MKIARHDGKSSMTIEKILKQLGYNDKQMESSITEIQIKLKEDINENCRK